jgi:hypothetical protein
MKEGRYKGERIGLLMIHKKMIGRIGMRTIKLDDFDSIFEGYLMSDI